MSIPEQTSPLTGFSVSEPVQVKQERKWLLFRRREELTDKALKYPVPGEPSGISETLAMALRADALEYSPLMLNAKIRADMEYKPPSYFGLAFITAFMSMLSFAFGEGSSKIMNTFSVGFLTLGFLFLIEGIKSVRKRKIYRRTRNARKVIRSASWAHHYLKSMITAETRRLIPCPELRIAELAVQNRFKLDDEFPRLPVSDITALVLISENIEKAVSGDDVRGTRLSVSGENSELLCRAVEIVSGRSVNVLKREMWAEIYKHAVNAAMRSDKVLCGELHQVRCILTDMEKTGKKNGKVPFITDADVQGMISLSETVLRAAYEPVGFYGINVSDEDRALLLRVTEQLMSTPSVFLRSSFRETVI